MSNVELKTFVYSTANSAFYIKQGADLFTLNGNKVNTFAVGNNKMLVTEPNNLVPIAVPKDCLKWMYGITHIITDGERTPIDMISDLLHEKGYKCSVNKLCNYKKIYSVKIESLPCDFIFIIKREVSRFTFKVEYKTQNEPRLTMFVARNLLNQNA